MNKSWSSGPGRPLGYVLKRFPRVSPRREQLLRAPAFERRGDVRGVG
jgi:hypothetical protein